MPKQRVAVVGAGMGGLVSALSLANHGIEVTVVERGSNPGGKIRQQTIAGLPIDVGPTVLTMRSVFEEIFAAAGTSLSEHLTLKPQKTLARHAWSSDETLDLHADLDHSAEAIGAFAGPAEARRYRQFCQRAQRVYETLEDPFMYSSRPNPFTLVKRVGRNGLGGLAHIKPFTSLWRALGKEFRDPRLQQLFGRYATYMGSSPFSAPATLMLIAHVERTGVCTVEGGMYQIAQALYRLAQSRGVKFRFATEAKQVIVRRGRVVGLELLGGENIEAEAVIINADAAAVADGHFGADIRHAVPAFPHANRSLSALTWAVVANTEGFQLLRHTVFFSADYASEFKDIFSNKRLPQTPTVYVCAQDREGINTPTPSTPERLFCLVNAPPTGDKHTFDQAEIESCRQRAFDLMQRCGLNIAMDADAVETTAPDQFNRLFPATGGALYGPASHGWRASFRRPGSRTGIAGLYLAGGSTHPGAGIPMAALSGSQAAAAVLQDMESLK